MDDLGTFLTLVSKLSGNKSIVPEEDAEDARKGATSIPSEVTCARRDGKTATFHQSGTSRKDWYWTIEGLSKQIKHD